MDRKALLVAKVSKNQSVAEMVESLFASNIAYLLSWEALARSCDDPSGVHQFRVALRRMRSLLTLFREVMPSELSLYWRNTMRDLAGELGEARDLDVLIGETLPEVAISQRHPGAELLLQRLERSRSKAYARVNVMLDGERYRQFRYDFPLWIATHQWQQRDNPKIVKRLKQSAQRYAYQLLDKRTAKVIKVGGGVDHDDAEALHQLRIEFKKLRYAAESFAPIFPKIDKFLRHGKGMQELLGSLNDLTVMDSVLDRVRSGESATELHHFIGMVSGWQRHRAAALLTEFAQRWQTFASAQHSW
ncbi:MAG: CHAD domain-containing protein [Gammaproteobacteria bacterium]|nr:CHAD domain-containing protein [Gammaproteobacteria bacterium]